MPVAPMLCYLATSVALGAAGVASNAGSASGTGSTALALRELSAQMALAMAWRDGP